MGTRRSRSEIEVLAAEAERRVRAGQSLTEVARVLGVPRNTLFDWAARGGWREKDLHEERAGELARLARERIAAIRRREEEADRARRAQFAEALERARSRAAGMSGGSGSAGSYHYARPPLQARPADSPGWPPPTLDGA
jgi:hypothetical protein